MKIRPLLLTVVFALVMSMADSVLGAEIVWSGLVIADNVARISGVSIGGDTGAGGTPPLETFYIANDPAGQLRVPGWEGVGLPARGGIVAVAFEPFTVIQAAGSFFGMFVQNNDGSARYVEGMMTGWYWSLT